MFSHSGDESILEGCDTTHASCLLSVYLIIPCYLVNAICPTFIYFVEAQLLREKKKTTLIYMMHTVPSRVDFSCLWKKLLLMTL